MLFPAVEDAIWEISSGRVITAGCCVKGSGLTTSHAEESDARLLFVFLFTAV